ncbi:MAG: hypothetical protein HXS44_01240 [Theionarchaea archaeon]|nr:hypothetical protein [Theionarchaea archaeon]
MATSCGKQERDGCWKTKWWKSDIYATTEIALLMDQNGYRESALHALNWLEKTLDHSLNTVEYALLIKAFSRFSDYSDSLNKAILEFLTHYRSKFLDPTFDSVYFAGLIDCRVYRLSIVVSSLRSLLGLSRAIY